MTFFLEYHKVVRCFLSASLSLLGFVAVPLFLISASHAQTSSAHASPAHANSAHVSQSAPAHAASVAPPTALRTPPPTSGVPHPSRPHPLPNPNPNAAYLGYGSAYYYPYIYGVPYAADADGGDASAPNDPNAAYADDEGGPPAFDRHAPGPDSYPPPRPTSDPSQAVAANDPPASSDSQSADPQSVSAESPTPLTTLVFKDGHVSQVANYAIVSQTLYDLTPGHPRRIALADLDLSATEKQNDDRGVTFQLPPNAQAN
jgi:hypothetical protein